MGDSYMFFLDFQFLNLLFQNAKFENRMKKAINDFISFFNKLKP